MNQHAWALLAVLIVAVPAGATSADEGTEAIDGTSRVMSFNIRYNNPNDGENAWPHRRDWVAEIIAANADVAGLQEALRGQIGDLEQRLSEFDWYGVGRDDGVEQGEFTPIFYRRERFELLEKGSLWLSDAPDQAGSKGWDAALPRVASWARLKDKTTGRRLLVANTHFDHRGQQARQHSAKLLRERLAKLADGDPVVLTGDFNATPSSEPYRILTGGRTPGDRPGITFRDAFKASPAPSQGPSSTWTGFTRILPGRRIDFVMVSETIDVRSHRILDSRRNGRFPSDHLPVVARLALDSSP